MTTRIPPAERRRTYWWYLIPFLLVIALFGTRGLDMDYIWIDEFYSIGNAGWLSGAPYNPIQVWQSVSQKSPEHAPGYFMILAGWAALTGWTPFGLRALSLLFGLLATATTYQAGRTWFSRPVGLYAAVVVSVSAHFIYFTHELRMYTLLAMWTAFVLWMYGRIILHKDDSHSVWIGFFMGVAGALYTHYYSAPVLMALGLFHLLFVPKNRRWLNVTGIMALAGVLFLPWVQVMLRGATRTAEWDVLQNTALSPVEILQTLARLFSNGQLWLLALVIGLALIGLRIYGRRALSIGFLVIISLAALLMINVVIPNLTEGRIRYLTFLWPLLALLAGMGIAVVGRIGSQRLAVGLLSIWLLFGLVNVDNEDFLGRISNNNIRTYPPLTRIRATLLPLTYRHDLMVSIANHGLVYLPGKFNILGDFYLGKLAADRFLVGPSDTRTPEEIAKAYRDELRSRVTVWLVTQPSLKPETVALYREPLKDQFTLCETPVNDEELRIDRYDVSWFDCQSRTLPQIPQITFENNIALLGLRLSATNGNQIAIASAWSIGEVVPPETYSVSFKLWNQNPEHAALADFGLPYPGTGWYATSISTEGLEDGPYRLTATVYNWKTGQRLEGSSGAFVGDEVPAIDFVLPLTGVLSD